jgi:ABC-2 type transport system permease protein
MIHTMHGSRLWITYRIAENDFRYTWKERSVIFWMFVMPIAFILFFGFSSRGSGRAQPRARLTIENQDHGFLSGDLIDALKSENIAVIDSLPEGAEAVRTFIIPDDFTRRVLSREPVTLLLSRAEDANINASEAASVAIFRGLLRMVAGLIEIEAEAVNRGDERFAIIGDSLHGSLWEFAAGREGELDSIRVRLDTIQSREALVSVAASQAGRVEAIPSGFQASVPGTLVMFVLMAMVFSGTGITAERAGGVLRRLGMTPAGKGDVVLGKLIARIWVAGIQIAFLLLFGTLVLKINLGNNTFALVLLMLSFAFCTGSFSILFGSLFRNPDQVAGFAIITTLVMSALGGCWWPLEVVSQPFRVVAFCLPTGWAIHGIHRVISFGYGLGTVLSHIGILCGFGVVFILIASRRLKWHM